MNICLVNSFWRPDIGGGAELTLATLAEGLVRAGHSVTVIATTQVNGALFRKRQAIFSSETVGDSGSIRVIRLPIPNIYWQFFREERSALLKVLFHGFDSWNIWAYRFFRAHLEENDYDIVGCHNLMGFSRSVWSAAKRSGVCVIQTLHDYYHACPGTNMYNPEKVGNCVGQCGKCKLFRIGSKRDSLKVDAVVGVSAAVVDRMLDLGYFGAASRHVVNNARREFVASGPTPSVKLPQDRLVFGYIGSIYRVKGVHTLIEALRKLLQRQPDLSGGIELIVAGGGDAAYLQELTSASQGLPIRFVGQVNAMEFFRCVDVTVVPSEWGEPLAGVVIESMSFGVPVIGSDLGGTPEMVRDGISGRIFKAGDVDGLADLLCDVLRDRKRWVQYGKQAIEDARHFCDRNRQIQEYEEIYCAVIAARSVSIGANL